MHEHRRLPDHHIEAPGGDVVDVRQSGCRARDGKIRFSNADDQHTNIIVLRSRRRQKIWRLDSVATNQSAILRHRIGGRRVRHRHTAGVSDVCKSRLRRRRSARNPESRCAAAIVSGRCRCPPFVSDFNVGWLSNHGEGLTRHQSGSATTAGGLVCIPTAIDNGDHCAVSSRANNASANTHSLAPARESSAAAMFPQAMTRRRPQAARTGRVIARKRQWQAHKRRQPLPVNHRQESK